MLLQICERDSRLSHCSAITPGLVSVIVPILDRHQMLEHLLRSLSHQTYKPIEVVVVDDGSIDLDAARFSAACARCGVTNAKYIRKPHGGAASARNAGIAASTGEYIHFLDSDDLLFPEALSSLIQNLSLTGAAYCVGDVIETDYRLRATYGSLYRADPSNILRSSGWSTHAALYRRSAVLAVGEFEEGLRIGEDSVFQLSILLKYGLGVTCDALVGVRRRHDYGHLCLTGAPAKDVVTFMASFADMISRHHQFRNEKYSVRLVSSVAALLALATVWTSGARNAQVAFHNIVNELMHDSPLELSVFKWLSATGANRRLRGTRLLLAAAKWVRSSLAEIRQVPNGRSLGGRRALDLRRLSAIVHGSE